MIIGGIITWIIKSKIDELKIIQENIRNQQIEIYSAILEPIIRIFSSKKNKAEYDKAIKQIISFDYKKTSFNLILFGSDNVIKAYNDFMHYIYIYIYNGRWK